MFFYLDLEFLTFQADNICQLRLDIETFELSSPNWSEDCPEDSRLTISESVTVPNNFPLCGKQNETRSKAT